MSYRVNAPRFAAESFENEVVILDVAGGVYYSLEGVAAWIYQALAAGAATGRVVALCDAAHRDEAGAIVQRLLDESILVPADEAVHEPLPPPAGAVAPRMTRFDDLQMLLQIDPVHDVDATGWPNPASS
jgi:hypothetical protein